MTPSGVIITPVYNISLHGQISTIYLNANAITNEYTYFYYTGKKKYLFCRQSEEFFCL